MASQRQINDLAFVGRQLAARTRDRNFELAVGDLEQRLPNRYKPALELLKSVTSGDGEPHAYKGTPWWTLKALATSVASSRERLFVGYNKLVEENQMIASAYWTSAISSMSYLAVVAAVAAIVSFIFVRYTIPGFDGMFTQFGADLPALTKVMLTLEGAGALVIASIILVLVVSVFLLVKHINNCLRTLRPANAAIASVPIANGLLACHQEGLFLNFMKLLRGCGVSVIDAAQTAASASGLSPEVAGRIAGTNQTAKLSRRLSEIAIAVRLETVDDELDYQCSTQQDLIAAALVSAHGNFSLIVKTALFVFVGLMVIAMYLPIFKLGALI